MIGSVLVRGLLGVTLALGLLAGCGDQDAPATGEPPPLARELVFYDWADDMPQSVLDAFAREFGVKVVYATYATTEEALENLRAGKVYDVVVIDNPFVPELAAEARIAEIDHRNCPQLQARLRQLPRPGL